MRDSWIWQFVLDFLPQKPLKEQEMVLNNYGVWVISGLFVGFINFQQQ